MEHRHRKKETAAPASTHHLFVHVKSLMSANLGEELEVFFHIYDGRENRPLRYRSKRSKHRSFHVANNTGSGTPRVLRTGGQNGVRNPPASASASFCTAAVAMLTATAR